MRPALTAESSRQVGRARIAARVAPMFPRRGVKITLRIAFQRKVLLRLMARELLGRIAKYVLRAGAANQLIQKRVRPGRHQRLLGKQVEDPQRIFARFDLNFGNAIPELRRCRLGLACMSCRCSHKFQGSRGLFQRLRVQHEHPESDVLHLFLSNGI